MTSSPSIPASGTGANPWPAARTAVVVSLGRMRKIFPTKLPPSLPLAAWIRKKIWGGSTTQCRRWQWEEQDTGTCEVGQLRCHPGPLGAGRGGRARQHSREGEEDPGGLLGPCPLS